MLKINNTLLYIGIPVMIVLQIVAGVVIFFSLQPQLVTGHRSDLTQVIITEHSNGVADSTTIITEQSKMYAVYNQFKRAFSIASTRQEQFYTMQDVDFTVVFYYSDEKDEISVHKSGAARWLGRTDYFSVSTRMNRARMSGLLDSIKEQNT